MGAMALIVKLEFAETEPQNDKFKVWGRRPWAMLALFIVVGLTNLAKGPLVGAAVVIAVVGTYLLFGGQCRRMSRYLLIWGWLIMAVVAVARPSLFYVRSTG